MEKHGISLEEMKNPKKSNVETLENHLDDLNSMKNGISLEGVKNAK